MITSLRIASWNIAGTRKMKSLKQFDYSGEDVVYFANSLKAINADIICLQEVHINETRSTASEIAELLDFPYVYEVMVSDSHIDDTFNLGNAILSRHRLDFVENIMYPYPDFDLYFKNGQPAKVHHKMVQIYMLDNLMIANTQMLPLDVFNESYAKGKGAGLANLIDATLSEKLVSPLVLCADFNFNTPKDVYPNTYTNLSLIEALPERPTCPPINPAKVMPDHILVSSNIKVRSSDVVEVEADHYLCYADIKV